MRLLTATLDIVVWALSITAIVYLLTERDELTNANYILPKSTWVCADSGWIPHRQDGASTQHYDCITYVRNPD